MNPRGWWKRRYIWEEGPSTGKARDSKSRKDVQRQRRADTVDSRPSQRTLERQEGEMGDTGLGTERAIARLRGRIRQR